ncbi:hypothetical protein PSNIH1_09955 [Pantoea sp. PSNIH1]|nr:hypothetical protein PSNIH1_09955 [Pantoea sp. PSNIH1]
MPPRPLPPAPGCPPPGPAPPPSPECPAAGRCPCRKAPRGFISLLRYLPDGGGQVADFPYQLRRLQPVLLPLFIEYRRQRLVRVRGVAAQPAHRRLRQRTVAAAVVRPRQQPVRHVPRKLAADAAPGAHARALMLHLVVRPDKPGTRTPTTAAHYYRVGYRPNRGQPNPLPQLIIKGS